MGQDTIAGCVRIGETMATDFEPINDYATYKRVQAWLISTMNTPLGTPDEEAELQALADAADRYALARWPELSHVTDGVSEVESMLDRGSATLEGLLEVFGGREALVAYMTRRQQLDDETIDVIVERFNTKREWIDKPFCKPAGWVYDVRPGDAEWWVELTEMVREQELVGVD